MPLRVRVPTAVVCAATAGSSSEVPLAKVTADKTLPVALARRPPLVLTVIAVLGAVPPMARTPPLTVVGPV